LLHTEVLKVRTGDWIDEQRLAGIPKTKRCHRLGRHKRHGVVVVLAAHPSRVVVGVAKLFVLQPSDEHGLIE